MCARQSTTTILRHGICGAVMWSDIVRLVTGRAVPPHRDACRGKIASRCDPLGLCVKPSALLEACGQILKRNVGVSRYGDRHADLVAGLKSTIGAPLLTAYTAIKRSEAAYFKDASPAHELETLWHRY